MYKKIMLVTLLFFTVSFPQAVNNLLQNRGNIEEILNAGGTIRTGVSGSYNTIGYTLNYGKNNEPILKKINSINKTSSVATWSALIDGSINGVDNIVSAIAINGTDVYVGGSFTTLGDGTAANYIAKWNGSSWSALIDGSINGVGGQVNAIAISGTDVYVGGNFTTLGDGTAAKYIAKWNGSSWSALIDGSINGVGNVVRAIAISGTNVYVGGAFTTLGNGTTVANYIAKWNGSTWSALIDGSINGLGYAVNAIAISGTDVYVGGQFTTLGDYTTSATRIAKWNGSSWSALTDGSISGVSLTVHTIAISGTDVYVGGDFTTLGDRSTVANRIAKWNGSSWSALTGSSINGVGASVFSIVISGTDVYVGGDFTTLGDGSTLANRLVKWNGTNWSVLTDGSSDGVANTLRALAVNASEGTMYVGGDFTTVGASTTANRIAKFADAENVLPVELTSFTASVIENVVALKWETTTEVNNHGFEIERKILKQVQNDSWEKVGFVAGAGNSNSPKSYSFTDQPTGGTSFSYRIKQIDNDGKYKYYDAITVNLTVNQKAELIGNYPNPFNPSTTIKFYIPNNSDVTIKIYDILGKEITTLFNKQTEAGYHIVYWNGLDRYGNSAASGVYLYRLQAVPSSGTGATFIQTKKMALLK